MFWNKSSTSSTVERAPEEANNKNEEGREQETGEPSSRRAKELDSKISREVLFQRANSQISGNEPLSCMKSFDKLLGCYSVSNQIKAIYRFGNLDYERCNHSFRDLKFCLNLKYNFDNSDPQDDQQSFQWNLRKAEKVFEAPNSQDVWEARAIKPLDPTLLK
ncbi:hypothetical protein PGT21_029775 [Puccinia graminis f. sp. tritici]|uniref:Uncharacterized protein n=2 Tax=Puccinia graminis f. sp. tritici TaxID=56615 RepID=E3K760_PUCGT|nr:uncharacterized protein PGTG_05215 [Puccinia graminis f. sp. tritici CRL 75-36-700-3]EFP79990.1 hypothetical protein PGTG_05215 [Puccinia graminis f. sp. tritici CRL 75-36-700-3]KAA1110695.1 hypothetical protein PGT21_029775 [Puccinia graminis f. sp. tritici]KAA1139244.1 hypothetical protein PGTUg99_037522 [Puccinia graminis f. sp. tritici]